MQSRTQIQTKSEKVEAVDKPIKAMDTLTLNKSDIKFTIENAGKYATQAFYLKTKEGYAYLSQRKDKEVVISKCINATLFPIECFGNLPAVTIKYSFPP